MTALLEHVVDSFEKLEVIVHLHRTRPCPQHAVAIGRTLQLPPVVVADALATFAQAGLVRTRHRADDAGWWLEPSAAWANCIEILVELYELDRGELLRMMKHVAFQRFRAIGRRSSPFVFSGTPRKQRRGNPS